MSEVVYAKAARAAAQFQKPCEIKNHCQLSQFRWLQADRTHAEPTVRGVGFIQKENPNQHDQHEKEIGQHEFWLAQAAVIQIDHGEHRNKPKPQPKQLTKQKMVTGAVLLARGERRGAEN